MSRPTDADIDRMSPEELRNELRGALKGEKHLSEQLSKCRQEKKLAAGHWNQARIDIQSVQAIRHLQRNYSLALGTNVDANIHNLLGSAVSQLDHADLAANEIPF